MAKVAKSGSLASNALPFNGDKMKFGAGIKRKTPTELRGELLKSKHDVEIIDESPAPLLEPMKHYTDLSRRAHKSDSLKNSRYVDTRMNELFPARKPRTMSSVAKENIWTEQPSCKDNISFPPSVAGTSHPPLSCVEKLTVAKDDNKNAGQATENSQNRFRSVAQLSLGSDPLAGLAVVDMDKALKGLVAHELPSALSSPTNSSERLGNFSSHYPSIFCAECFIPGKKSPLDLTLKTYMRVVSSSSVAWIHRSLMSGTYNGMTPFSLNTSSSDQQSGYPPDPNSKALHSWIYPQSSLPASVISALIMSASGRVEMDFLSKRQQAWEDSFRSLYYMLRKNLCGIFYVCTLQFVVMFTACDGPETANRSCNAYVSQSTRGLRSLLKENGIHFSMPLSRYKVEQATTEDFVELKEIEKYNLGQTRRQSSKSDVDNTSQSLLVFKGSDDVHGLYDFLLNYRTFLTSLNAVDVPLLYSPVLFQNASISVPQITCKELKRADHIATLPKGSNLTINNSKQGSSDGLCYSIEVKDSYLPPWVISAICDTVGSKVQSFEASFMTDLATIGLNVALESVNPRAACQAFTGENFPEPDTIFGIADTIFIKELCSAYLKGLKYKDNSYTASLSYVQQC